MRASDDDPVEALLRERAPYLDDDGFTARVIGRLPPARNLARLRALVLLAAAAIAGLVVLVWPAAAQALRAVLGTLGPAWRDAPANTLLAGLTLLALIVWGCAAAATSD
jgi:hypothetical protein